MGQAQRRDCDVCARSVTVLDTGELAPHYRQGRISYSNERHCPGGQQRHVDGVVREVPYPVKEHQRPTPSEGELSVRTVRGGLPTLGK